MRRAARWEGGDAYQNSAEGDILVRCAAERDDIICSVAVGSRQRHSARARNRPEGVYDTVKAGPNQRHDVT